jgi:hypothetical protein
MKKEPAEINFDEWKEALCEPNSPEAGFFTIQQLVNHNVFGSDSSARRKIGLLRKQGRAAVKRFWIRLDSGHLMPVPHYKIIKATDQK